MRITLLILVAALCGAQDMVKARDLESKCGAQHSIEILSGKHSFTTRDTVLILSPQIPFAVVNGKTIQLSCSPEIRDSELYVPSEILSHLKPAAEPSANTTRKAGPHPKGNIRATVVIDPGHGGMHTGCKSADGIYEKDVSLNVSRKVRDLLQPYGINVVMTRNSDMHFSESRNEDLATRVSITRNARANLFVSIHCNWVEDSGPRGTEVFYSVHARTSDSRQLANIMLDEILSGVGTPSRGVKERQLYVTRNATCPAVLVEMEFLSNRNGANLLQSESGRASFAGTIANAITRFLSK